MDSRLRGEAPLRTPLRSTPRIELKYSGALRKHVRGYWTSILGGMTDGGTRGGCGDDGSLRSICQVTSRVTSGLVIIMTIVPSGLVIIMTLLYTQF